PIDGYILKGINAGSLTFVFNDTIEKTVEPTVTKGTFAISAMVEKYILHAVSWTNANPDGGEITVTRGSETISSGTNIEHGKEILVTLKAKDDYTPSLESDVSGSITETATGSEGLIKIYKVTITKPTVLTAMFIKKQAVKATIRYAQTGEGTVAFFTDAALTKPIDTKDGLKIEIGTTVYVKATPANAGYEAKAVYSTDSVAAHTLTADSNGIFQFVAADENATLSISFVVKTANITSRIKCLDSDTIKAGTIEWKLSDSKIYDSPAKVEYGKTINVRIKATEGYHIAEASGTTIAEDAQISDIVFDLTVNKDTELTATFKAVSSGTIIFDTKINGLPEELQSKVKLAVTKTDGTPVSATDKIVAGTKLRIVASTDDNRYRFITMSIGSHKATISENGLTAVINDYTVASPVARESQSSFTLPLDITMMRRTLTVTYASGADNVRVTVISTDEKGIRRSIASGATVEVDTELLFQATPNDGYEIESVKIIPTTGLTLTSTAANFDTDGVCSLTTRTPVIVENNAVASYKIEIVA
ncbi:MAG: hypothetical protein K2L63_06015, partial [Paramuribaculum sp.]|nr:hypothetical protein [Paramuribaculum sp.]